MFNLKIRQDGVFNQMKNWAYSICPLPDTELFSEGTEKFQLNKRKTVMVRVVQYWNRASETNESQSPLGS